MRLFLPRRQFHELEDHRHLSIMATDDIRDLQIFNVILNGRIIKFLSVFCQKPAHLFPKSLLGRRLSAVLACSDRVLLNLCKYCSKVNRAGSFSKTTRSATMAFSNGVLQNTAQSAEREEQCTEIPHTDSASQESCDSLCLYLPS